MSARVGSVVVEVLPGGNVGISLAHQGGITVRDGRVVIERADYDDLRQALATVDAPSHGRRSSDESFNRFVRTGAAATVVRAEQSYVMLEDGRIVVLDPKQLGVMALWLRADPVREARELARQLLLAADELERRRFE